MSAIQRALISVSDKTGVVEFAQTLRDFGVEILSTGGTAELLRSQAVPVVAVSDYTGFPEMMEGRVKTLHPKIHGGILGRRDRPEHLRAMETQDIRPIDLVVINLYPFEQTTAKERCTLEEAVENIDIGGPAMVRSAAKNFRDVTVVVHPADYPRVVQEMRQNQGAVTRPTRQRLSRDAFAHTARYDALIARYLTRFLEEASRFPSLLQEPMEKVQDLRYGENPHQSAALYRQGDAEAGDIVRARQLQGKELSFNNYLDLHAAWELVREFDGGAVAIIKHTNPCGVALGEEPCETFIKARKTDPLSAFGGIIGFNRKVTAETAQEVTKNFVEAVVAPGFEPGAREVFAAKKNIRLMEMASGANPRTGPALDFKRIGGGILVQDWDRATWDPGRLKPVTQRQPDDREMNDLKFAWIVAKHVKSNAIVYVRDGEVLGVGAGQMSRVDSAKIAGSKAHQSLQGCVMASDAFFPFRDSIDEAARSGVAAIIQPGGSIRDEEVIEAADEHGMAMVFTGIRHFRH